MVARGLVDRYVNVYFPSKIDKERWERIAKEKGLTLSKFIYETVEASLYGEKEAPRAELVRDLSEAREDVQKLRREIKTKNLLLEKLETELYKSRFAGFADIDVEEGSRYHDEDIIKILKRGKTLDGHAILNELGIDPRDTEAVKLVGNQLESLRRFGLAKETSGGWKWVA